MRDLSQETKILLSKVKMTLMECTLLKVGSLRLPKRYNKTYSLSKSQLMQRHFLIKSIALNIDNKLKLTEASNSSILQLRKFICVYWVSRKYLD
jgi:DNA topoisomerase IB